MDTTIEVMDNLYNKYCICCLSKGRKLWPLVTFLQLLLKQLLNNKFIHLENASVCWECHAVLRNISKYVNKVNRAQVILAKYGENFKAKSLSTLSIHKNIKNEIKIESNELNTNNKINVHNTNIVKDHPEDVDNYGNGQIKTEQEDTEFKIYIDEDPFFAVDGIVTVTKLNEIKDVHELIDKSINIEHHNSSNINNATDDVNDDINLKLENSDADIEFDADVTKDFASDYDDDVDYTNNKVDHVKTNKNNKDENKALKTIVNKSGKKFTREVKRSSADYVDSYEEITMEPHELDYWRAKDKDAIIYKQRKFKCELCIRAWSTERNMKDHIKQYHQKKTVHFCDICKSYFSANIHLKRHVNCHYNLFKCKLCGEITHTRKQIQFHFDHEHKIVYSCVICSHTFGSLKSFNDHYNTNHGRFICDYCERDFKSKNRLINHIFCKHIFYCKQCKKYFKTIKQLQYHNSVTHEIVKDETTFCVECNRQFDSVLKFKTHTIYSTVHCEQSGKAHLKAKHTCPECNNVYSQKQTMIRHYKFVHLKKTDFYCEDCDKYFLRKVNFWRHYKIVHEGVRPVPVKNKFCNICGRGFSANKILINHIRTHTGERPFECGQCPSKFAQKAALRSHMRNIHKNS